MPWSQEKRHLIKCFCCHPPHSFPSQQDQLLDRDTLPSLPQSQLLGCLQVLRHIRAAPEYNVTNHHLIIWIPLGFHSHPSAELATVQMQVERPPKSERKNLGHGDVFVVPVPRQRQFRAWKEHWNSAGQQPELGCCPGPQCSSSWTLSCTGRREAGPRPATSPLASSHLSPCLVGRGHGYPRHSPHHFLHFPLGSDWVLQAPADKSPSPPRLGLPGTSSPTSNIGIGIVTGIGTTSSVGIVVDIIIGIRTGTSSPTSKPPLLQ